MSCYSSGTVWTEGKPFVPDAPVHCSPWAVA